LKIFSAAQIKEWDNYTITHEPVPSIELMERAAMACCGWLQQFSTQSFIIFCGVGNNGGDGLAIARILFHKGCRVSVYYLASSNGGSADFKINFARLDSKIIKHKIDDASAFPVITKNDIVIDALFGTGLNKTPQGVVGELIDYINQSEATIISIDIPSGLFADKSSIETESNKSIHIIKSAYTLTFQQYKLCFLMAENHQYFGKIILLDIGLHKDFYNQTETVSESIDFDLIKKIYKRRDEYTHKGNFGHACLLAGSYGMMGAAVLSAGSCLRSGAGKLTCIVCEKGYAIMQTAVPEAMARVNGSRYIKQVTSLEKFNAIGVGPGIGIHTSHKELLRTLFTEYNKPIIIDADALNILSQHKKLLKTIPGGSILTPHPSEFDRLFGSSKKFSTGTRIDDFKRFELAREHAKDSNIFIILKGHHTLIACPDGHVYFNFTGNAGMATAGSGDVLTGILTGLLAQGYTPLHTCILGVYLHGLAGDIAANKISQEAMIAGDITACLGEAFINIGDKSRH
jgi:NAD(P)H-hydrate epimerase